jgi:magnesium-transporting ATPase (P-type)
LSFSFLFYFGAQHKLSFKKLAKALGTSVNSKQPANSTGLTDEEAAIRLQQYGPNALKKQKIKPAWQRYIMEYISAFPMLLMLGGILCIITWGIDSNSRLAGKHDNV